MGPVEWEFGWASKFFLNAWVIIIINYFTFYPTNVIIAMILKTNMLAHCDWPKFHPWMLCSLWTNRNTINHAKNIKLPLQTLFYPNPLINQTNWSPTRFRYWRLYIYCEWNYLEKKARIQALGSVSNCLANSSMNCITIVWWATWVIRSCFWKITHTQSMYRYFLFGYF